MIIQTRLGEHHSNSWRKKATGKYENRHIFIDNQKNMLLIFLSRYVLHAKKVQVEYGSARPEKISVRNLSDFFFSLKLV